MDLCHGPDCRNASDDSFAAQPEAPAFVKAGASGWAVNVWLIQVQPRNHIRVSTSNWKDREES